MDEQLYCYICKHDGSEQPIADLHWHGMGVHPRCLISLESKLESVQKQYEKYAADCYACTPYLKEGETPAECIARNRADTQSVLRMLAEDRTKLEQAQAKLEKAMAHPSVSLSTYEAVEAERDEALRRLGSLREQIERFFAENRSDWATFLTELHNELFVAEGGNSSTAEHATHCQHPEFE